MKKLLIGAIGALLLVGCGASKNLVYADKTPIQVSMDLNKVANDQILVEVNPGAFSKDAVSFMIPKTVPGTYSTDNYGKYIEGLKAFDYEGNEMTVSKTDENTWNITNGKTLDKITYYVNDTFDSEGEQEEPVFSPAGTNIEADKNFMLNLHGFVGYFEGFKEVAYTLNITVPSGLSATTSLPKMSGPNTTPNLDVFTAGRYFEVIDNPILYAKPNTETFQINDIQVTLSVYSPNSVYTAASLKEPHGDNDGCSKSFPR